MISRLIKESLATNQATAEAGTYQVVIAITDRKLYTILNSENITDISTITITDGYIPSEVVVSENYIYKLQSSTNMWDSIRDNGDFLETDKLYNYIEGIISSQDRICYIFIPIMFTEKSGLNKFKLKYPL